MTRSGSERPKKITKRELPSKVLFSKRKPIPWRREEIVLERPARSSARRKRVWPKPNLAWLKPRSFRPSLKECLVFLSALMIVLAAGLFYNSRAVLVEIWPVSQTIQLNQDIVVDTSLTQADIEKKLLPGKIIEEEKTISRQFQTTGASFQEKKAKGVIRVYNNFNAQQILVAKTRFLAANGKLFYSQQKVSIPAGAWIDVEVEASEAGPEYNIGPTAFSIPGLAGSARYTAVYGKSSDDMAGGWRGQSKEVSKDDLAKAKEVLLGDARTELSQALRDKIDGKFVLLEKAQLEKIIDASSLAPAGTQVDQFNYKVKIKTTVLVFEEGALKGLLKGLIARAAEQDKDIDEASLQVSYQPSVIDLAGGTMIIAVDFSAKVYSAIDKDSLRTDLAGKSFQEVTELFKNDSRVSRAKIKFWPFWKRVAPEGEANIRVEIKRD